MCVWGACGVHVGCVHIHLCTHIPALTPPGQILTLYLICCVWRECLAFQSTRLLVPLALPPSSPGQWCLPTIRPATLPFAQPLHILYCHRVWFIGCGRLGERAHPAVLSPVIPVLLSCFAQGGLASSVMLYLRVM